MAKRKKNAPKLGVKGKLRKVEAQLAKRMVPVQRMRQRVCALNLAVSAGRKTVSKAMRQDCARRYPLRGGLPMSTGPLSPMPATPRAQPAYEPGPETTSFGPYY